VVEIPGTSARSWKVPDVVMALVAIAIDGLPLGCASKGLKKKKNY